MSLVLQINMLISGLWVGLFVWLGLAASLALGPALQWGPLALAGLASVVLPSLPIRRGLRQMLRSASNIRPARRFENPPSAGVGYDVAMIDAGTAGFRPRAVDGSVDALPHRLTRAGCQHHPSVDSIIIMTPTFRVTLYWLHSLASSMTFLSNLQSAFGGERAFRALILWSFFPAIGVSRPVMSQLARISDGGGGEERRT